MRLRRKEINISEAMAHDLGTAIVTRRLPPDEPFPIEAELCRRYGASRTTLREAVKMLTAKGLVSVRPRQGARIGPRRTGTCSIRRC